MMQTTQISSNRFLNPLKLLIACWLFLLLSGCTGGKTTEPSKSPAPSVPKPQSNNAEVLPGSQEPEVHFSGMASYGPVDKANIYILPINESGKYPTIENGTPDISKSIGSAVTSKGHWAVTANLNVNKPHVVLMIAGSDTTYVSEADGTKIVIPDGVVSASIYSSTELSAAVSNSFTVTNSPAADMVAKSVLKTLAANPDKMNNMDGEIKKAVKNVNSIMGMDELNFDVRKIAPADPTQANVCNDPLQPKCIYMVWLAAIEVAVKKSGVDAPMKFYEALSQNFADNQGLLKQKDAQGKPILIGDLAFDPRQITDDLPKNIASWLTTVSGKISGVPPGIQSRFATPNQNQAPLVKDISLEGDVGSSLSGKLLGNDPDGDKVTFSVSTSRFGSVSLNANTGEFTYTPNKNMYGTDTFRFEASDGRSISAGIVTAKINYKPPTLSPGIISFLPNRFNSALSLSPLLKVYADEKAILFVITKFPKIGKLVLVNASNGHFEYHPPPYYYAADEFSVRLNVNGQNTPEVVVSLQPSSSVEVGTFSTSMISISDAGAQLTWTPSKLANSYEISYEQVACLGGRKPDVRLIGGIWVRFDDGVPCRDYTLKSGTGKSSGNSFTIPLIFNYYPQDAYQNVRFTLKGKVIASNSTPNTTGLPVQFTTSVIERKIVSHQSARTYTPDLLWAHRTIYKERYQAIQDHPLHSQLHLKTNSLSRKLTAMTGFEEVPNFGRITSIDYHTGDFTYEPDPGFVGADSFKLVFDNTSDSEQYLGIQSQILVAEGNTIPIDPTNLTTSVIGDVFKIKWDNPLNQLSGVRYRVARDTGNFSTFPQYWWGGERFCPEGIDIPPGVNEYTTSYSLSQPANQNLAPFYDNWDYVFRVCAINEQGNAFSRGTYKWIINPKSTFKPPSIP